MSIVMSVIIPAYNAEQYIVPAIRSALSQSLEDIEVILIDDGSTDTTHEKALALQCAKLRIIRQSNEGECAARNTGIRVARGKYIGFLDADDLWHPHKAQRHVEVMEKHEKADLTFAWWRVIDEKGRDTGRRGTPQEQWIGFQELLLKNVAGNGSTVVARRTAIEEAGLFDPNITGMGDHDLWLRIARLRFKNVFCIREILSDYRIRADQLTKDWQKMLSNWEKLMAKMMMLEPKTVAQLEAQVRRRYEMYLAYLAHESDDHLAAREFLFRALQGEPALLLDRSSWITTGAVLCTFLPAEVHRWLADTVKDLRMPKHQKSGQR